jgi:hypothetical protein
MQVSELLVRCIRIKVRVSALIEEAKLLPSGFDIVEECLAFAEFLVKKNAEYGDSALNPNRIFSKADPVEQIRVRIDDKLNRLIQGRGKETEDVVCDLIGYLVLLRVAERRFALPPAEPELAEMPEIERPLSPEEWNSLEAVRSGQILSAKEWAYDSDVIEQALPSALCQYCSQGVPAGIAVCDVCYRQRYGRDRIDLSHVQ